MLASESLARLNDVVWMLNGSLSGDLQRGSVDRILKYEVTCVQRKATLSKAFMVNTYYVHSNNKWIKVEIIMT